MFPHLIYRYNKILWKFTVLHKPKRKVKSLCSISFEIKSIERKRGLHRSRTRKCKQNLLKWN